MSKDRSSNQPEIHGLLARRWSPRAFDPDSPVSNQLLAQLLEAARWAPSCFNDQPWRYVLWNRPDDQTAWQSAFDCLAEGNQRWVKSAPVLLASISDTLFRERDRPNRWGPYDTGAATENLFLQATALGLSMHQMGGFDKDQLREAFSIPSRYDPMAMTAIGHPADPAALDERYRESEQEIRDRQRIETFAFAGTWGEPFRQSQIPA